MALLDVVIPYMDLFDPHIDLFNLTKVCVDHLQKHSTDVNIVLVDNGSVERREFEGCTTIHNSKNLGMIESLRAAIPLTTSPYIAYIHNDVLIHEPKWDTRIVDVFESDPKLGMIGFAGAVGIDIQGERIHTISNMQGKVAGANWSSHGGHCEGMSPAVVLDGLALIFRRTALENVGYPDFPPHHWYDKAWSLMMMDKRWRVAIVGIEHDHPGGQTAFVTTMAFECYREYLEKHQDRLRKKGLPEIGVGCDENSLMYIAGSLLFHEKWGSQLPLYVDADYNYKRNYHA